MKKVFVFGVSVASLGAASLLIWFYSKANSKRKHRIEIQIPDSIMGYMIGRCGDTLKKIQMKSNATIHFLAPEGSSNYVTCVIKGDSNSVQLAAGIINDFVNKFDDEEDTKSSHFDEFEFQVANEDLFIDISNVIQEILDNRSNHLTGTNDLKEAAEIKIENVDDFISQHTQKLYSPGGDGLIPVYVSAVCDPEQFWIQIKNGYLCAVLNEADNRWYRAEVWELVSKNDENSSLSEVDLYLLDFGESIYEKVSNLRPMPSEFFNLNFQAIKCGLSNIKAIAGNWTEEAVNCFEDIVHAGQWYTLMARIDFHDDGYRPYLTLIDNNGEMPVNIAETLVANGFAKALD